MENPILVIPAEIQQLAEKVTTDKQQEVSTVLNQIFTGTSDWESQVDAIEVKGIEDKMSISLADAARLNVKKARIAAEKIFDAKREEVQQKMTDFKTEDLLWLKAKQIMQIKFKAIEEKAEWKAKYVERYEREQKQLRTENRRLLVAQFAEIPVFEFENMSDESFNTFLSGLEKDHNDKIEAARKAEEERIAREKAQAEERERIRLENERLKKEAEERERVLKAEREKAEAERKAQEEKARKEREAAELKLKKEREERERVERELKAKKDAEEKARIAEQKRIEAEQKSARDAERKAKAAPDKQKLLSLAELIEGISLPDCKSEEAGKILIDTRRFLNTVSTFIREKTEQI